MTLTTTCKLPLGQDEMPMHRFTLACTKYILIYTKSHRGGAGMGIMRMRRRDPEILCPSVKLLQNNSTHAPDKLLLPLLSHKFATQVEA